VSNEFSVKTLFKIRGQNLLIKGFPTEPRAGERRQGERDLKMTNKENKQYFLHRCITY
jgi:hypothetical protein